MSSPCISSLDFVDLYIGEEYCDIKGLAGEIDSRVRVPVEFDDQVDRLRQQCKELYKAQEEPEFSLVLNDVVFRVTQLSDVTNKDVFILRKSSAQIRQLSNLGLAPHVLKAIRDPSTRGLILICGEMASGKTSTAASIVVDLLTTQGGICMAIEDPPETPLNGVHGKGRCIQVRASRKNGGFAEQMIRAVRSGADIIFIGEIRDSDTAYQVLQAGINGHLIIATIHSGDGPKALERMITFAKGLAPNAQDLLGDGIAAVLWQNIEKVGAGKRLQCKPLIVLGTDASTIRTKIKQGKISTLAHDIEEQNRQAVWAYKNT